MIKTIKNLLNSQLYTISLYARQISGTVVLLMVTRFLSVYDYGLFRSYGTIAGFCLMFANLGFSDYILVSSKANVQEVKLKILLFLSNAFLLLFLTGFGTSFFNLENYFIFLLVLIRTFFDGTFFSLMLPYYQASSKFNLISYVNIFYSVMTILLAVLCYVCHYNLIKFLLLGIGLGVFNFIQCSYYAKLDYILFFKHFKQVLLKLDKSILYYIGTSFAWFLYAQIPPLFVSLYVRKTEAALFFAAFSIANIIYILVNAQNQKILPELIKSTYEKSKQILYNNLKFILCILLVILLFFVILGRLLLSIIYGSTEYSNANYILIILSLGNMFVAIGAVFGAYITAKNKQKYKIKMMLEASIFTIISLIIMYKLGIYAAAISFLLAAVYAGLRYAIFAHKLLDEQKLMEIK